MAAKAAGAGTAIKDALKQWEEKTKENQAEATVVKLRAVLPSIVKLDGGLTAIPKVQHLSLSTNAIEKISNLNGLCKMDHYSGCRKDKTLIIQVANLTVLSLARNNIKKIEGLEPVSDTLEELWLSYNQIEKVNGIECCRKLKVFYLSNNKVKGWDGIEKLKDCPLLEDVLLLGNPLEEKCTAENSWRPEVTKRFLTWKRLDNKPIIRDEAEGDAKPE